jgi:hypothetical protein
LIINRTKPSILQIFGVSLTGTQLILDYKERDMLDTILLLLVGAFIGWHFPEPSWAKVIKAKVLSMIQK